MNRSQYPDEINNLINKCNDERFSNPDLVIEYSEQIHSYADKLSDTALAGLADFYIGDAYFTKCNSTDCMRHINAAIKELYAASEWQQLGECYNLLGILCEHQGNFSGAIESYSDAINLIDRYELNVLGTMVYANYSNLLHKSGDNEAALSAILACSSYCNGIGDDPHYSYLPIQIQISIAKIYIYLWMKDESTREIAKLEQMYAERPEQPHELDYYYLKLIYSDLIHDEKLEEIALKELIDTFLACEYKVDYLDECIGMMEYFKRKGRYDLLRTVLSVLRKVMGDNDFTDTLINISGFRIDLLQHEGRWGSLLEEYRNYRNLSIRHKKQVISVLHVLMDIKRNLKESEQVNFLLQKRIGTDALTGLANRQQLTDISGLFFESALKNDLYFGVEMLDIDFFKLVNDTYGHHVGDECLCAIADVLKSISSESLFCSRYGGDEFMILYKNHSDEDITRISKKIRSQLSSSLLAKNLPEITISQGICNSIPKAFNKVWDFSSEADSALYKVKKNGRNGTMILHIDYESK